MSRRISITIPDKIERTVLARMDRGEEKQGAFGYALLDYIRELEIKIAMLERVAASGSAPAAPAPKAADTPPTEDWGTEQW